MGKDQIHLCVYVCVLSKDSLIRHIWLESSQMVIKKGCDPTSGALCWRGGSVYSKENWLCYMPADLATRFHPMNTKIFFKAKEIPLDARYFCTDARMSWFSRSHLVLKEQAPVEWNSGMQHTWGNVCMDITFSHTTWSSSWNHPHCNLSPSYGVPQEEMDVLEGGLHALVPMVVFPLLCSWTPFPNLQKLGPRVPTL